MADLVYAPGHKFGYIGDDQYFGSWQGKTVESWNDVIEALHARYHLPVLANEWGYSSGGAVKETRPDPAVLPEGIPDVCYEKSWFHAVEGGHTEAVQAEYLRRGLQIFAENPHVLGSFLFCFQDARTLLSLRRVRLSFRVLLGDRGRGRKAETGICCGKAGEQGLLQKLERTTSPLGRSLRENRLDKRRPQR